MKRGADTIRTAGQDAFAARTFTQIADELARRGMGRVSRQRVQQICTRAERKLRMRLRVMLTGVDGMDV